MTKYKPAILLITFNRPDTASQVLEMIRAYEPSRLYFFSDGPRIDSPSDSTLVAKSRNLVSGINWDCDVKTYFSSSNLGCKYGPISAINWFFEHETEGIILEDDCLPTYSFFDFCGELLATYRNCGNVFSISGNNFSYPKLSSTESIYFSIYPHIWGWATWKRAWNHYDPEMTQWNSIQSKRSFLSKKISTRLVSSQYWENVFERVAKGGLDAWDYQWFFAGLVNDAVHCIPNRNLVSNLGFGQDATHTTDASSWLANRPVLDLKFPLALPLDITANKNFDDWTERNVFGNTIKNFVRRILSQIIKSRKSP